MPKAFKGTTNIDPYGPLLMDIGVAISQPAAGARGPRCAPEA